MASGRVRPAHLGVERKGHAHLEQVPLGDEAQARRSLIGRLSGLHDPQMHRSRTGHITPEGAADQGGEGLRAVVAEWVEYDVQRDGTVVVRRDDGATEELSVVVAGGDDPGPLRRVQQSGESEPLRLGQRRVAIGDTGAADQRDEVGPLTGVETGQGGHLHVHGGQGNPLR